MFHIHISGHKYRCAKYTFCFILIGEKRLGTSEDTRDPPPTKEGKLSTQPEDVEEGQVVEIVTTTGDAHVVEEHLPISPLTVHKFRTSCFVFKI
ncbi:hypothetical protein AB205_0097340 [Aquarana catesbeiana]|uniref:Uncharacterized protein n=1 Tax=Aquarana catesbeiana TaxID=8400 RepID=A0A2G9SHG6_AQUCT|nr:hypothetical protein AB205_0097340 [Aquarana catesbeiana]